MLPAILGNSGPVTEETEDAEHILSAQGVYPLHNQGHRQPAHCASLYLVADLPAMIYKEQRDLIPSDFVILTILPCSHAFCLLAAPSLLLLQTLCILCSFFLECSSTRQVCVQYKGHLLSDTSLTFFISLIFLALLLNYLFFLATLGLQLPPSGFLQLQQARTALHCARASPCSAPLVVDSTGSRAHGLRSCGARASLLCCMWDLPRPGMEIISLALAGGFLTT